MILQKGEKNNEKKILTIINVAYGIGTYNTVLKNINVIYSRVLSTEPLRYPIRELIIIAVYTFTVL